MQFKNYKEYKDYTLKVWQKGRIDELKEEGLLIDEPIKYENGENSRSIQYRFLSEEEFNKSSFLVSKN